MIKKSIPILVLLSIVLCAFFYLYFLRQENKPIDSTTVTVGWIGPLTGSALGLGIDNLNAVKLALSEYQLNKSDTDPDIKLVVSDDGYDFRRTEIEYEKMVRSHHPAVIMISTYTGLIKVAERAQNDSILLIDPIDNDKNLASINKNIFLIAKETENIAGVLSNVILDQNKKNVAIFCYKNDDFMLNLAIILKDILQKNKAVATIYSYDRDSIDFHPILKLAKDANSDAFVFFGYTEIAAAMQQARELGIPAPYYASNNMNQLTEMNSQFSLGKIFIPDFTTLNGNEVIADEFINKYINKFEKKPLLEWTAMQSYDASVILFNAIQSAYRLKGDFTEQLRNELLSTSNFKGVTGNISILPSGASRGIYFSLYNFDNGKAIPAD